jgi:hypothetical protein
MSMQLTKDDERELTKLEEELWTEQMRFDIPYMREVMCEDFFEYGISGKLYRLDDTLDIPRQTIQARIPLDDLKLRLLSTDVAQVTYNSHVTYNGIEHHGRRSSIWVKAGGKWRLKFHQGTPYQEEAQQHSFSGRATPAADL